MKWYGYPNIKIGEKTAKSWQKKGFRVKKNALGTDRWYGGPDQVCYSPDEVEWIGRDKIKAEIKAERLKYEEEEDQNLQRRIDRWHQKDMPEPDPIIYPSSPVGNPNTKYLFFDTETTGLPNDCRLNTPTPRIVSIAWLLMDGAQNILDKGYRIVKPRGYRIPSEAVMIHFITTTRAKQEGVSLKLALTEFSKAVNQADYIVAHNIRFDLPVVRGELKRAKMEDLNWPPCICTMESSTNYCELEWYDGATEYKWPQLSELHWFLFDCAYPNAHDAMSDVNATRQCFFELVRRGVIQVN